MLAKLIKRPIGVTMSLIMVIVLGMVSIGLLPVSLIPNIDIPYITVQVNYPSQSARELESIVTTLRQQLMQLSGLKEIRTDTKDGSGVITLTFNHGIKSDYLFIEVNEKIDRAMTGLPREMDRPNVIKAGASDIPAFYINLTLKDEGDQGLIDELFPVSDKFSELSEFASHVIAKRLEQLPEVAMVDVSGYVVPEVLIIPDRDKMRSIGMTTDMFASIIKSVNVGYGKLTIRDGEYQYNVMVKKSAQEKKDIENLFFKFKDRLWQVKDIAQVIEHPQPRESIVKSEGKDAITMAVIKQSDARMSKLKTGIDDLMGHFKQDYPDIEFSLIRDQTELLDYSIDNLIQNIIFGILLASAIILLFMQNLRSAFLIVLTIPVALILAMLFFWLMGITINIVSLSGLVLGVGMMVDNSIIVIDNITYRWTKGEELADAVVKGTKEVFAPMLSSILTTCAVFIPLIFLSGIAGSLFYDQAMAITITLFCSLIVTVTVLPVYFYLVYRKREKFTHNKFLEKISFDKVIDRYERGLKFLFRRSWIMWGCFLLAIGAGIILFSDIRKEKLPDITYTDMLVNVDWNERITVDENNRRTLELSQYLSGMTENITIMSGIQQFLLEHTRRIGLAESVVYIKATEHENLARIEESIHEYMETHYPDAVFSFESSGNIFDMVFADKEASLVARLRTTSGLPPEADKLNELLNDIAAGLPEQVIAPIAWQEHVLYVAQPEIMALYEVSYNEIYSLLQTALNDNRLFTILQGKFSIPVIIGDNKSGLSELLKGLVVNKGDVEYPITMFLKQTKGRDLRYIVSGAEGIYYPVDFYVEGKEVAEIMDQVTQIVGRNDAFDVSFSGTYFSNRSMMKELIMVLLVSILLLYFILASQFESIVQPLIILSEILIDICGVLIVLWIFDLSINLMSLIGIIVTCGIVINDSILKIDTINQFRKAGMPILRAIIEGGRRRLKPIIMTSLTTILAVSPFLARGDMGSDLQFPLSIAVIAGMVTGTLVSVYFIPLIYYTIYRRK